MEPQPVPTQKATVVLTTPGPTPVVTVVPDVTLEKCKNPTPAVKTSPAPIKQPTGLSLAKLVSVSWILYAECEVSSNEIHLITSICWWFCGKVSFAQPSYKDCYEVTFYCCGFCLINLPGFLQQQQWFLLM